jgi:hypothetical protein
MPTSLQAGDDCGGSAADSFGGLYDGPELQREVVRYLR